MALDLTKLVDKEALQSVDYLYWLASIVSEEFLAGLHPNLKHAYGAEFSQYKNYQTGDDIRMLDWKQLAKSGKYYIKLSDFESNVKTRFIIDASKSMALEGVKLSKLDFARIIAATLAYIAHCQGDFINLQYIQAAQVHGSAVQGHSDIIDFLYQLSQIYAEGKWFEENRSLAYLSSPEAKELIVVLTDHYERDTEIADSILKLKSANNEVIVGHLSHQFEIEANYPKDAELEDMESGERILYTATTAKKLLQKQLKKYKLALQETYRSNGVSYLDLSTAQGMNRILWQFLKRREVLL